MTAALIVIEVAAPQVSEDALSTLVSACTRAARDARCVLTKDAPDEQPAAVAIVSLQGSDKMRVEVGLRQGEHDSWRTKDFAFLPVDDPLERWRVVGFAVGTLAESNIDRTPDAPPKPPHVAPPAKVPPPPRIPVVPPRAVPGPHFFLGAGALFGPGLERGAWRIGGTLRLEFAPRAWPVSLEVGAAGATRVASGSSGAAARWFNPFLGGRVALLGAFERSGLDAGAALIGDYFDASASVGARNQAMSRWTIGGQASIGARLQIAPPICLTAELQAALFSGSTSVSVASGPQETATDYRILGSMGLRVRLR